MYRDTRRGRIKEKAVDPRPLIVLVVLAVLLLVAVSGPERALGLSLDLSTGDMTALSSRIVTARVLSASPRADATNGIVTEVVLEPLRTLKGRPAARITLTLPGGTLDGRTLVVSEVPDFTPGEEALVFLGADGRPVAGRRGKLAISNGVLQTTGEPLALVEARIAQTPQPSADALAESLGLSLPPAEEPAAQDVTALATPAVVSVSPPAAPAGVGAVVKITGSGFGTQGSSSRVEFYYRNSTPIVANGSAIKAWSDTQIQVEVPVGIVDGYAASAGSGPLVVVAQDGSRSAGSDFTVTFGYGGTRWTDLSQEFYVLENTADTTGEGQLVRNAATTWSAASQFSLAYDGAAGSPSSGNSRNEVWWADSGRNGILAEARYWYWNGDLYEADVTFNDAYTWGTGATTSTFDIQTVALHEFGHWLSLRDLYGPGDTGDVMYGVCGTGVQKRTLSAGDSAGIRWIYDGLDITAPVTSISGVPQGWSSSAVEIGLDASDDTGPVTTYYRIGSGAIQTYAAPFTISTEGASSIRYWSIDGEGNTEAAKTATVLIDRTPPVTTVSGPLTGYGRLSVALDAEDPLSGVAHTYYRVDGGEVRDGDTIELEGVGSYSIEAWSQDAAGNIETPGAPVTVSIQAVPEITLDRVAGIDRYATAAAVSAANFAKDSASTAVLATGSQFADALAASGLAGAYDGPLLLTRRDSVPAEVESELARLGVDRVAIVGGTGAVSATVEMRLGQLGYAVERIAGADRYATAAAVARRIRELTGVPTDAFVARGDDFADALAAAPYAYSLDAPILLVKPTSLPVSTASVIAEFGTAGLTDVTIAGGTGAVSAVVESQIAALGPRTTRAAGASRYATAAALVRHAIAHGWTTPDAVGVTTGENFPDALGGGVAIGSQHGAVLLTRSTYLHGDARAVLEECADDIVSIDIFGGDGAIAPGVVDQIKAVWNLP